MKTIIQSIKRIDTTEFDNKSINKPGFDRKRLKSLKIESPKLGEMYYVKSGRLSVPVPSGLSESDLEVWKHKMEVKYKRNLKV